MPTAHSPALIEMIVAPSQTPVVAPGQQTIRKLYPNFKVIVLNDDFNTFQHVAQCLLKYIPT